MSQTTFRETRTQTAFPWVRVRERNQKRWPVRKVIVDHGLKGQKLKHPISALVPADLDPTEEATLTYVVDSLKEKMPRLIPFSLENWSIFEMAKFLYKYRSRSRATLWRYIHAIGKFCSWAALKPDQIIIDCIGEDGVVNAKTLQNYASLVDQWVGQLQALNKAPMTVNVSINALKAFFKYNGLDLPYSFALPRRIVNRDRAPTPEEIQRILDVADVRAKTIVSMLALGGFRVGTLQQLRYYHVQRDLEAGVVPIHIHVEAEITKGKYHDYDTFIGAEAAENLRLYIDMRRRGALTPQIPPEQITPETPLIRSHRSAEAKPLDSKQIYRIVHALYFKAGILDGEYRRGRFYGLRVHSLRKFFRTQMAALGVPADYIEYMMGHTLSTYHDIQMKGVEFLRQIYIASGISIKPRVRASKIEMLKEMIRAWGMNPEEILTRQALTQPHATRIVGADLERDQMQELSKALREMLRRELLSTNQGEG